MHNSHLMSNNYSPSLPGELQFVLQEAIQMSPPLGSPPGFPQAKLALLTSIMAPASL